MTGGANNKGDFGGRSDQKPQSTAMIIVEDDSDNESDEIGFNISEQVNFK